ncbi:MAG: 5'-nucleosidase, partial [Acinetobacter sp.]|nr:5'-nucleosidase [Acinetobacter sp.]
MMQPLLLLALPHENADDLLLIDELALHYTGVGKVNAAITATKLLSQASSPQLVINAGSAGSHTL